MTGTIRTKFNLWRDINKGFKSRFNSAVKNPVINRPDIPTQRVQSSIDRGDRIQEARLKRYPSINVDFDRVYAGSIQGDLEDAEEALFRIGFRNGPLAYVEVTDRFGPDDGSYWLHIITETGKLPVIENRLGLFRRIKDQVHVVVWEDEDRGMVHFGAHREQSALLQPARHVAINEANARRGIRDFRNKWSDEFGQELERRL